MTVRQWYFGMVMGAAALIPLGAHADSIMNLAASPNYAPAGSITLDYAGVSAEIAANLGINPITHGSCIGGACLETTYGAGVILDVTNNITFQNEWTGGVVSAANPTGSAVGFVIYGIADQSVNQVGPNQTIDNTGATASGGVIHIDLYSMSAANTPCFSAGCGANNVTAAQVAPVTSTLNSNVFNGATLFAAFDLVPGVVPQNGPTNPLVTLTQQFNVISQTGNGQGYAVCVQGPGCSDFTPVTEAQLDATGTGYAGDPTFANDIVQIFLANQIKGPTIGNAGDGWLLSDKDPVYAVTPSPVPEPASLGLLGGALMILGVAVHRRRRKGMSA